MKKYIISRYTVNTGRYREQGKNGCVRAVFLSDLHNVSYGKHNETLFSDIEKINPDFILVGGDMLVSGKKVEMEEGLLLLEQLTKNWTVFAANGNHEQRMKFWKKEYQKIYSDYAEKLRKMGVHLLENTGETFKIGGINFKVTGYEIPIRCFKKGIFPSLSEDEIKNEIGECSGNCFQILLAHHPLYAPVYAKWGADLTLSGHLHGGIVRLPFLGGIISPQFRLFPKFDRGLYRIGDKNIIVSAGLGSHTIPVRINNPAQLIVVDFI